MWYVVQTPVGREAEAAEKLNHFIGIRLKSLVLCCPKNEPGGWAVSTM